MSNKLFDLLAVMLKERAEDGTMSAAFRWWDAKPLSEIEKEHSVESLGDHSPIPPECPVLVLDEWYADDGYHERAFSEAASAEHAIELYTSGDGWTSDDGYACLATVRAWRKGFVLDEDGHIVELKIDLERKTIVFQPLEPECDAEKHQWKSPHEVVGGLKENPGVRGNGGGIIMTEVCQHCGLYRVTDTWDQSLDGQPREVIHYREADDLSLEWVETQKADA